MGYEKVKADIKQINDTITNLENQIPIREVRDKCGLGFQFVDCSMNNGSWKKAEVKFGATYGRYGSSSSTDCMTELLAKSVFKALKKLEPEIIKEAVEILKADRKVSEVSTATILAKVTHGRGILRISCLKSKLSHLFYRLLYIFFLINRSS